MKKQILTITAASLIAIAAVAYPVRAAFNSEVKAPESATVVKPVETPAVVAPVAPETSVVASDAPIVQPTNQSAPASSQSQSSTPAETPPTSTPAPTPPAVVLVSSGMDYRQNDDGSVGNYCVFNYSDGHTTNLLVSTTSSMNVKISVNCPDYL